MAKKPKTPGTDLEPPDNRRRIIDEALDMFNVNGERNVTTNHICAQTGISPGNLYYHFRNKQEIIYEIYLRLEEELLVVLSLPPERELVVGDIFGYVNGLFQCIWKYRFFFRDLTWMVENVSGLEARYTQLTQRVMDSGNAIYGDMVKAGIMKASRKEIEWLTVNSWVLLTYWLTYVRIHIPGRKDEGNVMLGIRQFVALFYGYLLPDARVYVDRLMRTKWAHGKNTMSANSCP